LLPEIMSTFPHFATDAIHVGHNIDEWPHNDVVTPICLATTFKQDSPAEPKRYDYARAGNATRDCLELCLASLENAKFCKVYSSGLSSTAAICGLLSSGDHVICCDDVYGGTQRYLRKVAVKAGIKTSMVDLTNLEEIKKQIVPETKLIWIETPTNPLLKVCDIQAICQLAKKANANIRTVVDNTFMTPYFQRPLELGSDIVMHSITKYLNGHADVVMGCVCTNDQQIGDHLKFWQLAVGANPSPFDCYLVCRGVKTLHVRMKQHQENGTQVVKFLQKHPMVEKVLCPSMPEHPQHDIHKKQCKGMSGMLSFYLKGNLVDTKKFLKSLQIFILAESLGGFESLAEHPALMTHASVPPEDRLRLGIGDNLVRLSVGLEEAEDLIKDLDQALNNCKT